MTQEILKLRPIGQNDYSVLEGEQQIGRIRYAKERVPGVWLWNVVVHIPGPPLGSSPSLPAAKEAFKTAWDRFKAKHGPEALAKAYRAMNLRDAD